MKKHCRLLVVGAVVSGLVGLLMTQVDDLTADIIASGEAIIEAGSEGLSTPAVAYEAKNTDGAQCAGPMTNCATGPSPDCDTGDCYAITTITVPTCVKQTAWIGVYHCYRTGVECENGACPDGFMCFNSVEGACSVDWWWFT